MGPDSGYQSVGLSDLDGEGSDADGAVSDDPSSVLDRELGDGEDFLEQIPAKPKPAVRTMADRMAIAREAKKKKRELAIASSKNALDTPTRGRKKKTHPAESPVDKDDPTPSPQPPHTADLSPANAVNQTQSVDAGGQRAAMIQRMKKEAVERKVKDKNPPPQPEKRKAKRSAGVKKPSTRSKKKIPEELPPSDSENEPQPQVVKKTLNDKSPSAQKLTSNQAPELSSEQEAEDHHVSEQEPRATSLHKNDKTKNRERQTKANITSDDDYNSAEAAGSEADHDLEENVEAALLNTTTPANGKAPVGAARKGSDTKMRRKSDDKVPSKTTAGEKKSRKKPKKPVAASKTQENLPEEHSSSPTADKPVAPPPYESPTRTARKRKLNPENAETSIPHPRKTKAQMVPVETAEEAAQKSATPIEAGARAERKQGEAQPAGNASRVASGSKRAKTDKAAGPKSSKANAAKKPATDQEEEVGSEGVPEATNISISGEEENDSPQKQQQLAAIDDSEHAAKAKTSSVRKRLLQSTRDELTQDDVDVTDNQKISTPKANRKESGAAQAGSVHDADGNPKSSRNTDGKLKENIRSRKTSQPKRQVLKSVQAERDEAAEASIPQEKTRPAKRRKTSVLVPPGAIPSTSPRAAEKTQEASVQQQRTDEIVDLTRTSPGAEGSPSDKDVRQQQGEMTNAAQSGADHMQGITAPNAKAQPTKPKSTAASRSKTKTAIPAPSAARNEDLRPAPGKVANPMDDNSGSVGHSWAAEAVKMLERLQRQFIEFKHLEIQTISASLATLKQAGTTPAPYSNMNPFLSSEERKDLKRQKLSSDIQTAQQTLFQKQEGILIEFAKDIANALDEANNATETTLGDILKKDSRFAPSLLHDTSVHGDHEVPSTRIHHPNSSHPATGAGEKEAPEETPNGNMTAPRRARSAKKDNVSKIAEELNVSPSNVATVSALKEFVGNTYEKLGLKCFRSTALLKICEKEGGVREEALVQLLPIASKTLKSKLEMLKQNEYLIEAETVDDDGQSFKVLTTASEIRSKR